MEITERLSPHRSPRGEHTPKLIVVHADAGKTEAGTISWLQDPRSKASYHYLVGRTGKVWRLVPEAESAWHAGVSQWPGANVGNSVNRASLGVCIANDGSGEEAYTDVQYEVGGKLIGELAARYTIPLYQIVGHSDVAPMRKTDPYHWFDWGKMRDAIALSRGAMI